MNGIQNYGILLTGLASKLRYFSSEITYSRFYKNPRLGSQGKIFLKKIF